MPELAEVAFASKAWKGGMGDVVAKVQTKDVSRVFRDTDPAKVKNGLRDTTLTGAETHGKKMLFQFSENRWLGLHLGMTGWLFTEDSNYLTEKHDALVLRQNERTLVFRDPRQFGYHRSPSRPARTVQKTLQPYLHATPLSDN